MEKIKIAFLGLGVMGYPMAGHLSQKGYDVCVYNRTPKKADKWLSQYQGTVANTPADAAVGADIVIACVGNDNDIYQICTGKNGAFGNMAANTVFIDHTTASANMAKQLADIAQKNDIAFIDAPVSGGQAGAENGKLTVMCGGDAAVFNRVEKILYSYAQKVTLMGETGSGQLTKMVNQICIAGLLQGLSEGLAFAENANLDVKKVFDVISKGAAQSWQMENRHETMLANEFDFGFAVKWMRKDLAICLQEAFANGSALPVTALVDQYYAQIEQNGGGYFDTSSLVTLLPRKQFKN